MICLTVMLLLTTYDDFDVVMMIDSTDDAVFVSVEY